VDADAVEVTIGPASVVIGPTDPPPTNPNPQTDMRDSAANRPSVMCGLGMVMSFFGTLLGLFATMVTRRRPRM
jgi:hypothetical protein